MPQGLVVPMAESLELRSSLAELGLVLPWVEKLASRYTFGERLVFAINLCLEEALSNIIRHGYQGDKTHPIRVTYQRDAHEMRFVIEDEAPHFRPSDYGAWAPTSLEELTPGGLGIPLMRRFSNRVEWEPLPIGNRLTLAFKP